VKRRTALLFVLLLGVAGFAAWSRRPPAPEPAPKAAAPAPPAKVLPADPAVLSRERHPGPIADAGEILSHFGETLSWQAEGWLEDLGVDVQVATLAAPNLPAESLAPQVVELRRVGAEAPSGGLLILLNPARGEARIEVSYALEPVLPDAFVGRLADDQLVPYAASKMAGMAVMDVLHYLRDFVIQQAVEGKLPLDDRFRARPAFAERARFLSGGAGASVRIPSAQELAERDFKARIDGPERARYAPGADPLASAEAFHRVQRDLAGDPSLELFTEGTRCLRRRGPVAPYEEIERARRREASRPWKVSVLGDRAVVDSESRAPGFVPLLLQRVDGLWRVDLAETWKTLFFDREGNYWLKNSSSPYAFGLAAYGGGMPFDVAPWGLGGVPLEEAIHSLEGREGALEAYLLGELLFRNCFLALDAVAQYERAAELAPGSPLFQETLARRAEYVGFHDLAIEAYQKLGDAAALDVARVYATRGDPQAGLRWVRRALARNAYDRDALLAERELLAAAGDADGAGAVAAKLAALAEAAERKDLPLELRFDPPVPVLEIGEPTQVGTTVVYDHANFSVTLENPSGRAVELMSVKVASAGTGETSGLGDIRGYWTYPSGRNHVEAGQSLTFDKTWGFTQDTAHEQLSYEFEVCWRGADDVRQCRTQRIDLLPR
jgi:tetratricopeptide (TPR) repeat protein